MSRCNSACAKVSIAPMALTLLVAGCSSKSTKPQLAASELFRGNAWLESQARNGSKCGQERNDCRREGVSDIDSDGFADCWRVESHHWSVWKGCRGDPLELDDGWVERVHVIPHDYASRPWLMWLGHTVRERVSCVGLTDAGCDKLSPRWQWILAATQHEHRDQIALYGRVEAAWQPLFPTAPREALIVADAAEGWLLRQRLPEYDPPRPAPRGARIITTEGGELGPRVPCAGFEIAILGGGLVAIDKAASRWRWLFAPFPHYGRHMETLICQRDIVIATDQWAKLFVDPRTGGWLFEPATDLHGARLSAIDNGDALWPRDSMDMIQLSVLGSWLSLPMDRRPPLRPTVPPEFQGQTFTEEDKMRYYGDSLSSTRGEPGRYSRDFESMPRDEIIPLITIASLADRGKCGGYAVYASTVDVIALRKRVGYLLQYEIPDSPRRISKVSCERGRIVVERTIGRNLLETEEEHARAHTDRVVLDVANGWYEITRPSM